MHQFQMGLATEQEHQDLTNGDPVMTAKIALDHLAEIPDYYTRLAAMEKTAKEGIKSTTDGGEGSGKKGHVTARQQLMKRLRERTLSEPVRKIGNHLDYRQLGERGMHPVNKKFGPSKVGEDIDYYDHNGDKQYGRVVSISNGKITLRDNHTKKQISQVLVDEESGKRIGSKG
jgi:hypothetical protein